MIYRSMHLKQEPEFTFVEKMFISNKLQHRFIGHTILLAKDLGIILLAVAALLGFGGILCLIGVAFKYVYYYLVSHEYSTDQAMEIMLLSICGIAVVGCVIKITVEAIKYNSRKMKAVINHKLNEQTEEDDGS